MVYLVGNLAMHINKSMGSDILNNSNVMVDAEQIYQEGIAYLNGAPDIKKDIRIAFNKFDEAGKLGHGEAIFQKGYLYMYGEPLIMKNSQRAFECFTIAANEGFAVAQFHLAECYLWGLGTDKVETLAFEYYLKAAQQGVLPAMDRLSDMYTDGIGTQKDINKAFECNEKVRGNGNHNAEMRYIRLLRERAAINS